MRSSAIGIITTFVLSILLGPLAAGAQQRGTAARIAFLAFGPPPSPTLPNAVVEEFQHALGARGWVEGRNLTIEWRWTEGGLDQFATLVADVLRLQVEIIVVPNTTTAQIAHKATTTTPIVVVAGGDLAESGLVASLARPGGNVTGVSNQSIEIVTKRLELLTKVAPEVRRVAMVRGLERHTLLLQALEDAARSLAIELHLFDVHDPTAFERAFTAMTSVQVHALFVFGGAHVTSHGQRIADRAVQQQLPSICATAVWVQAGCLMSYGPSQRGRGQQIAAYVDKILHGTRPAEIPVEQATRFEFVINLKTAQALGLTMPPHILALADEVMR